jgi:hypothetical protein
VRVCPCCVAGLIVVAPMIPLQQPCGDHGLCLGALGNCECYDGYTGPNCHECAPSHVRVGRACVFLPGALVLCTDGLRNGDEKGVDCGGSHCPPCEELSTLLGTASSPVLAIIVVIVVLVVVTLVAGVLLCRRLSWCHRCRRRCCPATLEGTCHFALLCFAFIAFPSETHT